MTGWKTIIFSVALIVLGFLETFDFTDILQYVPDQYDGLVVSAVGLIVAALRLVTKTPVGKKVNE